MEKQCGDTEVAVTSWYEKELPTCWFEFDKERDLRQQEVAIGV